MSIEGGARAGLIAPDEKTFDYIKGRPRAPKGGAFESGAAPLGDALFRRGRAFRPRGRARRRQAAADRHLGHEPRAGRLRHRPRAGAAEIADETKRKAAERSLDYMGLKGGEKITDIALDRVFIGSCTNGRIEDLREVAKVVDGRQVNGNVRAMIVPGSGLVKEQAEAEGLDEIFIGRRLRMARAWLLHVPRGGAAGPPGQPGLGGRSIPGSCPARRGVPRPGQPCGDGTPGGTERAGRGAPRAPGTGRQPGPRWASGTTSR